MLLLLLKKSLGVRPLLLQRPLQHSFPGSPPYGGRIHPLPASNCETPAARQPSRQCDSIGMQQQQIRPKDDDQIFVFGTAQRSHPTHSNHPVVVVTPATAGAVPPVTLGLNPVETPVPHRRQGRYCPKPHAAAEVTPAIAGAHPQETPNDGYTPVLPRRLARRRNANNGGAIAHPGPMTPATTDSLSVGTRCRARLQAPRLNTKPLASTPRAQPWATKKMPPLLLPSCQPTRLAHPASPPQNFARCSIMAPPRSASGAGTARYPQYGTKSPAPATSHWSPGASRKLIASYSPSAPPALMYSVTPHGVHLFFDASTNSLAGGSGTAATIAPSSQDTHRATPCIALTPTGQPNV
jgi:hypothetical protein